MIAERGEAPYLPITLKKLIPLEDLSLIKEATILMPDTSVEILKTERQRYVGTGVTYEQGIGKKIVGIVNTVPDGQVLVGVKTDPRNFSYIWREFEDLKAAREEKRAKLA